MIGVNDAATTSAYSTDIKGTSAAVAGTSGTYDYDEIGNLIKDNKEYISAIEWTVDRKVKRVGRNYAAMFAAGKNMPELVFEYDANRQRVMKIEIPHDAAAPYKRRPPTEWLTTHYVRDATGNTMATYTQKYTFSSGNIYNYDITVNDFDLYGSGRLGSSKKSGSLSGQIGRGTYDASTDAHTSLLVSNNLNTYAHTLGERSYELSNHLGNVIAVVSDRKEMATTTANGQSELLTYEGYPNTVVNQGNVSPKQVQLVNSSFVFSNGFAEIVTSGAVVNAQVYIKDVVGGNAAFVVQFKDLVTNQLVPGPNGYNFVGTTASNFFQQYNINVTVPASSNPIEMAIYVWNSSGVGNVYVDDMSYNLSGGATTQQFFAYYKADVKETHDYYPFGAPMPGRNYTSSQYEYGFGGKRKDNEIAGDGNSYDFGARQNDPRLGKWWSIDPQYKMYPYSSPYVAFGNNPIYYVDPGGETLRVAGDEVARATAQAALQKLTNNKVTVLANGIVKIVIGNENPGKNLVNGTKLISDLVGNKNTLTINCINTCENTTQIANEKDGGKYDKGIPVDGVVNWDPLQSEGGVDVNGSSFRPAEIGLGHELEHGRKILKGTAYLDNEDITFSNPDIDNSDAGFGVNEYNTRVFENKLRTEQGVPLRKVPEMINMSGDKINKGKDGSVILKPSGGSKSTPNQTKKGETKPAPKKSTASF